MNFTDQNIESYCLEHSSGVSQVLIDLERETNLKTLAPQMLSGRLQGQFLKTICHLLNPKRVLEIGTFTGYSAIQMASGAADDAHVDTIEANYELENMIRKYLKLSGFENKISLHLGDALELLKSLEGPYDLVFIDANKQDYGRYFELIMPMLKPGSFILVDNVLWSGKVLRPNDDLDAVALNAFNKKCLNDPRVEQLMLPIRDGISVIRVVSTEI